MHRNDRLRWLGFGLGALLFASGCPGDDVPSITTTGDESSGDGTTSVGPTTVGPTTDGPTTGVMTGGMDDTAGSEDTGMDDTAGSEDSGDTGMETTTGEPTCGDGVAEGDEECDGDDLLGEDCASQGFVAGDLSCNEDCTLNTRECLSRDCGDDMIQGAEVCDGDDLGAETCETQGFDGGTLACDPGCGAFDTSGCFSCGDDMIGGAEVCDGTDLGAETCETQGFDGGTLGCAADCSGYDTSACTTCGDDLAEGAEVCDGTDVGAEDCTTQGFDAGTLGCQADCAGYDTSACVDYAGDCCADNMTPGCDDATCTADVCAADAFCCNNNWDQLCANQAFALCPAICVSCGDDIINGADVCDGLDLGGETCETQGFDRGVLGCLPDCSGLDTAACVTWQGTCCAANGDPGCEDPGCTAAICAVDPFCCDNQWDGACAAAAQAEPACAGVSDCFDGACCSANGTPGCEDPGCTTAICAVDPFCCNNQWDLACANAAQLEPACTGVSDCGGGMCGDDVADPGEVCDGLDLAGEDCTTQGFTGGTLACAGDCLSFDTTACTNDAPQDCCSATMTGAPGCSDPTCESVICALDPFCCASQWDGVCASAANGSDGAGNECDICGFNCEQPLCDTGTEQTICLGVNACVDAVCAADPFCCNTSWDGLCVGQVDTVCGLICP